MTGANSLALGRDDVFRARPKLGPPSKVVAVATRLPPGGGSRDRAEGRSARKRSGRGSQRRLEGARPGRSEAAARAPVQTALARRCVRVWQPSLPRCAHRCCSFAPARPSKDPRRISAPVERARAQGRVPESSGRQGCGQGSFGAFYGCPGDRRIGPGRRSERPGRSDRTQDGVTPIAS